MVIYLFIVEFTRYLALFQNVKLGRVDCEAQQDIALQNAISKYPTLKIYRNGKALRKEYRGQRSVDAFSQFIKQHLKPSVTDVTKAEDLKVDVSIQSFLICVIFS